MASSWTSLLVLLASVAVSKAIIGPGFFPFFGPRPFLPMIRPPFMGPLLPPLLPPILPPILPPPILPPIVHPRRRRKLVRPSPPIIINKPSTKVFVPDGPRTRFVNNRNGGGSLQDKLTINLIDSRQDRNRDVVIVGFDDLNNNNGGFVTGGRVGGAGAISTGLVRDIGWDRDWRSWDNYGGGNEISVDGNLIIQDPSMSKSVTRSVGSGIGAGIGPGVGSIEYDYGLGLASTAIDPNTAAASLDPLSTSAIGLNAPAIGGVGGTVGVGLV